MNWLVSLVKAHSFQCSASQQRNEFEVLAQVSTSVFPQRPPPSTLINFLAFRKKKHGTSGRTEARSLRSAHPLPLFIDYVHSPSTILIQFPFCPHQHTSPPSTIFHPLLQGTVFKISELEPKISLPQLFLSHIFLIS